MFDNRIILLFWLWANLSHVLVALYAFLALLVSSRCTTTRAKDHRLFYLDYPQINEADRTLNTLYRPRCTALLLAFFVLCARGDNALSSHCSFSFVISLVYKLLFKQWHSDGADFFYTCPSVERSDSE